jgi:tRNA threonylcarbamoyl adenosine modification protein YjeE
MLPPYLPSPFPCQQSVVLAENQLPCFVKALSQVAQPHTVISIEGGLGAGKTTLIRTIGQAMGIQTRMTSPTYVYFNQYTLSPPHPTGITQVLHVDFYRLGENTDTLGANHWLVEELLELQAQAPTLILAEWASVVEPSFQPLITHQIQIYDITNEEAQEETTRRYDWYSPQGFAL